MKTIIQYISEAKTQPNPYTEEELKNMINTFENESSKLMGGTEDEDYHIYVKPNKFNGKFFNEVEDARNIWLKRFIEDLNKIAPELIVFVKTWDAIDRQSRINNFSRTNYCLLMPSTGMLFNNLKEAKSWIKEHHHLKHADGAKRIKCNPMTVSEAFEKIKELSKNYQYTKDCGVAMRS